MRIAVTGSRGRLGGELVRRGCIPLVCDITNIEEIQKAINWTQPDVVINCAAYTDVDGAESNWSRAYAVNTRGASQLRDFFDGYLVQISTDYVFDGKSGPYAENGRPSPLSSYGSSKWGGEVMVQSLTDKPSTIVRTTVLYGGGGGDFVSRVRQNLLMGESVEVSKKATFSPTYVPHLAEALLALVLLPRRPKIINLVGGDVCSPWEFAQEIAAVFHLDYRLIKGVDHVDTVAPRPVKAGLKVGLAKKLGLPIYDSIEGLEALRDFEQGLKALQGISQCQPPQ